MRKLLTIWLLLLASVVFSIELTEVPCGTVLTFEATPYEGYHFVEWSDGSTDQKRTIDVYSDTVLIAYFEENCDVGYELPVVARYDWLLMLNVKEIREKGYRVEEQLVTWYKVVGEPDEIFDVGARCDDEKMATGFYLTIDKNLQGTGDYYCVLKGAVVNNGLCTGLLRSRLVRYSSSQTQTRGITVQPTLTTQGVPIVVKGLNPESEAFIRVYSVTGQRLGEYHVTNVEEMQVDMVNIPGCFAISVEQDQQTTVLKYMVE